MAKKPLCTFSIPSLNMVKNLALIKKSKSSLFFKYKNCPGAACIVLKYTHDKYKTGNEIKIKENVLALNHLAIEKLNFTIRNQVYKNRMHISSNPKTTMWQQYAKTNNINNTK